MILDNIINKMHTQLVFAQWKAAKHNSSPIIVDGETLNLATTAVFGRRGGQVKLSEDPKVRDRIEACVTVLNDQLREGKTVYGTLVPLKLDFDGN